MSETDQATTGDTTELDEDGKPKPRKIDSHSLPPRFRGTKVSFTFAEPTAEYYIVPFAEERDPRTKNYRHVAVTTVNDKGAIVPQAHPMNGRQALAFRGDSNYEIAGIVENLVGKKKRRLTSDELMALQRVATTPADKEIWDSDADKLKMDRGSKGLGIDPKDVVLVDEKGTVESRKKSLMGGRKREQLYDQFGEKLNFNKPNRSPGLLGWYQWAMGFVPDFVHSRVTGKATMRLAFIVNGGPDEIKVVSEQSGGMILKRGQGVLAQFDDDGNILRFHNPEHLDKKNPMTKAYILEGPELFFRARQLDTVVVHADGSTHVIPPGKLVPGWDHPDNASRGVRRMRMLSAGTGSVMNLMFFYFHGDDLKKEWKAGGWRSVAAGLQGTVLGAATIADLIIIADTGLVGLGSRLILQEVSPKAAEFLKKIELTKNAARAAVWLQPFVMGSFIYSDFVTKNGHQLAFDVGGFVGAATFAVPCFWIGEAIFPEGGGVIGAIGCGVAGFIGGGMTAQHFFGNDWDKWLNKKPEEQRSAMAQTLRTFAVQVNENKPLSPAQIKQVLAAGQTFTNDLDLQQKKRDFNDPKFQQQAEKQIEMMIANARHLLAANYELLQSQQRIKIITQLARIEQAYTAGEPISKAYLYDVDTARDWLKREAARVKTLAERSKSPADASILARARELSVAMGKFTAAAEYLHSDLTAALGREVPDITNARIAGRKVVPSTSVISNDNAPIPVGYQPVPRASSRDRAI